MIQEFTWPISVKPSRTIYPKIPKTHHKSLKLARWRKGLEVVIKSPQEFAAALLVLLMAWKAIRNLSKFK